MLINYPVLSVCVCVFFKESALEMLWSCRFM